MSMTKQQKIGVCLGGAFGLCVLALGWFFYSAYADHQAALEGDDEEEKRSMKAWARGLGWTGKISKPEKML